MPQVNSLWIQGLKDTSFVTMVSVTDIREFDLYLSIMHWMPGRQPLSQVSTHFQVQLLQAVCYQGNAGVLAGIE